MQKNVILFGEYLLRLTPPSGQKLLQAQHLEMHWAGSEANVGVSLALLGQAATYITCLPQNGLAQTGVAHLRKYGLATNIYWQNEGRVGLFFYESGIGIRNGNVLYDRAVSWGFSFPLPTATVLDATTINLAFSYGQRGNIAKSIENPNGNIKEEYIRAQLGVTLNNRWFLKRRIE